MKKITTASLVTLTVFVILLVFFYGEKTIKYIYYDIGNFPKREVAEQSSGQAALYFPHIDANSLWQTEIAIINTSSTQAVTGTLNAFSNAGQLITTMPITLNPNARRQITVKDEFINPGSIGYIIFDSDSGTVQGYTKFYIQGTYRAAVPAVKEINTSDIYVSHIDSSTEWWTGLSLVNTTSTQKTIIIEFNTGEYQTRVIPANGHEAFTIRGLFDNQPKPDIKSATITNASGIIGLELFGSTEGSNKYYLSGILLKDDTTQTIYYPHVDDRYLDPASFWWTGIVAYNPADSISTITITPYTDTGAPLTSQTKDIEPRGKYIGIIEDLSLPPGTAWLKINSTNPITGFELFGTHDGKQLAGYTGVGINRKEGVFPKLDINNNNWTGIAFVNTEGSQASIRLTAYDDNGTSIASRTITLQSHAKMVDSAQNFFTHNIDSATYIAYSSDKEIVGFQLNCSSDNMMLDGLEGM